MPLRINNRKAAEKTSRRDGQEMQFLCSFAQLIPHAVIITNRDFRIAFVNQAAVELYGYQVEEMLGQTPDFLNAEPLAQIIQRDIYRAMSSRQVWKGTHLNRRKNGSTFMAEMSIFALPREIESEAAFVSVIEDITERKRQQNQQYVSREMLQVVLDNIPQRIFWKDRQCVYLGCNKPFADDAGLTDPKEVVGKNDWDLPWKQEEAEFYRQIDQRVMDHDQPELYILETQRTAKRGDIWLKTNKVPLHDPQGQVIGVLGTYEDITLMKRAEEALRESEEKYRTLVESAADAIFLADVETGYIIEANRKASELIGLPSDQVVGMHYTELHPRGEGKFYQDIFKIHTDGRPDFKATGFIFNRQGRKIPVQISGGICELNNRKVIIGIFRDITELKLIEDSLRRDKTGLERMVDQTQETLEMTQRQLEDARHLSEIGALAAMVAHELRNPLGVIKTALYNIKKKRQTQEIDRHIANIDKKINESERIIKELLNFAQIKMPRYTKVPVLKVLDECLEQCRQQNPGRQVAVKVERRNVSRRTMLDADPIHVNELLINILSNAYQAFVGENGKITVHLEHDTRQGYLNITVADNGSGIDAENLPRIFDPFFTTRVRGTGLGLSVCNQLVNLYAGNLDISSQKGQGTRVCLRLPMKRQR